MKHKAVKAGFFQVGLVAALLFPYSVHALPPLPSFDWPSPRVLNRTTDEQPQFGGINPFTKSLDNFKLSTSTAIFDYDESTGANHIAGNFTLHSLVFGNKLKVPLISIEVVQGERVLTLGSKKYRLAQIYSHSWNNCPNETHYQRGFALLQEGKYLVDIDPVPSVELPLSCFQELIRVRDTANKTSYQLQGGRFLNMQTHDGFKVTFQYSGNILIGATLLRGAQNIETLTLGYLNQRLDSISSSKDRARNIRLEYLSTKLSKVLMGGDLEVQPYKPIEGYVLNYVDTDSGKALSALKTIQDKQLYRFLLEPIQGRTIYAGVIEGPDTFNGQAVLPTRLDYNIEGNPLKFKVTSPKRPLNPITYTLHAQRGVVVEVKDALCQFPREKIEFIESGDNAGLPLRIESRKNCNQRVVKTFNYDQVGTILSIDEQADGQEVRRTEFGNYKQVTFPNGIRQKLAQNFTDPVGKVSSVTYSNDGRLLTNQADPSVEPTRYSYATGSNSQITTSTTITHPGSRRADTVHFDSSGRVAKVEEGSNLQGQKIETSYQYDDATGRLKSTLDPKSNLTSYQYISDKDPRILSTIKSSTLSSQQSVAQKFAYNSNFPLLPSKQSILRSENGISERTKNISYHNDVPLLLKTSMSTSEGRSRKESVLEEMQYDPSTLQMVNQCGFRSDSEPHQCHRYSFRSDASGLFGYLDSIEKITEGGVVTSRVKSLYSPTGESSGVAIENGATSVTTTIARNAFGQTESSRSIGSDGQVVSSSQFTFDPADKLIRATQKIDGQTVSSIGFTYDLATASGFQQSSRLIESHDSINGLMNHYNYDDGAKRLTSHLLTTNTGNTILEKHILARDAFDRETHIRNYIDGQGELTQRVGYNKYGELAFSFDPRNNRTNFSYDNFGRIIQLDSPLSRNTFSFSIDKDGREVVKEVIQNKTTNLELSFPETITSTFDYLGRSVEKHSSRTNYLDRLNYGKSGELASITTTKSDGKSDSYSFTYNPGGQLKELLYNGESQGSKHYDSFGNLSSWFSARGDETKFSYDALGRTTKTIEPDGKGTQILERIQGSGDEFLKIVSSDRAGEQTVTSYNSRGQVTQLQRQSTLSGSLLQNYLYADGKLDMVLSADNGKLSAIEYDYETFQPNLNKFGRRSLERTFINDFSYPAFSIGFSYDRQGALSGHIYPDQGTQASYVRDNLGRVVNVSLNGLPKAVYHFDGAFRIKEDVGPVSRDYHYDRKSWSLLGYDDEISNHKISSVTLDWDTQGQIKRRTDSGIRGQAPNGTAGTFKEDFTYRNRLLTEYSSNSLRFGSILRKYDTKPNGILDGIVFNSVDELFQLPEAFTYDPLGRPTQEFNSLKGVADFQYYRWNNLGLEKVYSNSNPSGTEFLHDPLGRFSGKKRDGQITFFARDNGMVLWIGAID